MSAVNYPAEGGASLEIIETSLGHLAQTGQAVAVSVTMWNPDLDAADKTAEQTVIGFIERFVTQLP
jgi:arginase family enzyme